MSSRSKPLNKDKFPHFADLQTRWNDNDVYGHVNNAVYYGFFDKLVNDFLIAKGLINIHGNQQKVDTKPIGLVVETNCHYFAPIAYPESLIGGLRVVHIGKSSVEYQIGLFQKAGKIAIAQGKFVHVYVNAQTRRPEALSEQFRRALVELVKDQ